MDIDQLVAKTRQDIIIAHKKHKADISNSKKREKDPTIFNSTSGIDTTTINADTSDHTPMDTSNIDNLFDNIMDTSNNITNTKDDLDLENMDLTKGLKSHMRKENDAESTADMREENA